MVRGGGEEGGRGWGCRGGPSGCRHSQPQPQPTAGQLGPTHPRPPSIQIRNRKHLNSLQAVNVINVNNGAMSYATVNCLGRNSLGSC